MLVFGLYFIYADIWFFGNSPKYVENVLVMRRCCSDEDGVYDIDDQLDVSEVELKARQELNRQHWQIEITDMSLLPF